MDLALYPDNKKDGNCKLVPLFGGVSQLVIKQFHPDTGKEVAPKVFNYDTEGVDRQIAKVDEQIAALEKSKAGMLALREDLKTKE